MGLTLTQAANLTNDVLVQGVAEAIVSECPLLYSLPFFDLNGSQLVWNEESALGSPSTYWYAVGDTWQEATFTPTQKTKALSILGGDADVDAFLAQTYRNPNDLVAVTIEEKAKAVGYEFNKAIIMGDSAVTTNQFDGIKKFIGTGTQRLIAGATGEALTLDMIDQLLDKCPPRKPDVLVMSRRTRRKMKALWRAAGSSMEQMQAFGQSVLAYDGVPILVDDNIPETEGNETGITGSNLSSVYALKLGMKRGLIGLTNGGLQVEDVGPLEVKNAHRYRIRWYCAVAITNSIGVARLAGVNGS